HVIVGREYFESIERRLTVVEGRLCIDEEQGNRQHASTPAPLQAKVDRRIQFRDRDNEYQFPDEHSNETLEANGVDDEDPTNGMGHFVFATENNSGFFGSSSNIAFSQHITEALRRLFRGSQELNTPGSRGSACLESGIVQVSRPASPNTRRNFVSTNARDQAISNIYDLPSEPQTLDLIKAYFSETGLLFPYIHEETFLSTYNQMKRNGLATRTTRRTWLGLLNIMLAMVMSTRVDPEIDAEQRKENAQVFYHRAVKLCGEQIIRVTSLESVQYLLLLSQYLQSTQTSIQTWAIHGLAVKAALQIGLHSSHASRECDRIEQETRKRVWYGCIVLDRVEFFNQTM
ncbi:hypothetical protein LTR02_016476, partial [Friedmanniomyces endolithicus]